MTAGRFDPIFNFDNFAEQFYRPAGSRAPELPCQKESRAVDWAGKITEQTGPPPAATLLNLPGSRAVNQGIPSKQ